MYCLTVFNGAPPTVDTKYEFVHNVGSRLFSHGYSSRNNRDDLPLIRRTARCIPVLGVHLDEQMHMVGHDLHLDQLRMYLGACLADDVLQPSVDPVHQDGATVFRTPYHVVFA